MKIASFVSSHGFGHAARSSAVMESLAELNSGLRFEIFSLSPAWFFEKSLTAKFKHHQLATDVGVKQISPFEEDLPGTLERLDRFYPFSNELLDKLIQAYSLKEFDLFLCDIAPLGISLAQRVGKPSVLVENFTWDWVYQNYQKQYPGMKKHIETIAAIYQTASLRIKTAPFCEENKEDPIVPPIARKPRLSSKVIRNRLGIQPDKKLIAISLGGYSEDYAFRLPNEFEGCHFLYTGAKAEGHKENLTFLPADNRFYHPDLIQACDLVVGKLGYSTLAEVFDCGLPFAYLPRKEFAESVRLASFVDRQMASIRIEEEDFRSGKWNEKLKEAICLPKKAPPAQKGRDLAAGLIAKRFFDDQPST